MYEIEHGIEIPKRRSTGGRKRLYPFDQMQVGDSIFGPMKKLPGASLHRLRQIGWSFSVRKAVKDGVEGLRIWRVK